MSTANYPFFTADDSSTEPETTTDDTDDKDPILIRQWNLGDHAEAPPNLSWDTLSEELDYLEDEAPGLADALTEAQETVETFSVGGFECPVCGLNHSHRDSKHDIRQAFNVTEDFAEQMNFCPYCHCGVSELARLVMYFTEVEGTVMFTDQERFEAVLELDTEIVQGVRRIMEEVSVQTAIEDYGMHNFDGNTSRKLTLDEAIEAYEIENNAIGKAVPGSIRPELSLFFGRVDDIRSSARAAPIPSETEQTLNANLGEL